MATTRRIPECERLMGAMIPADGGTRLRLRDRAWSRVASDAGSGTVLGLAVLAVVCFATYVGMARVQQVLTVRQVSTAADLAALAAAQATVDPCARAGAVAAANGAGLTGCWHQGVDVAVEVSAPMPELTAGLLQSFGLPIPPIVARSRAGYPSSS